MNTHPQTNKLTHKILLAMLMGALFGTICNLWLSESWFYLSIITHALDIIGDIFIASLKMMVVPLVFISLVSGVVALNDIKKLGRIGSKTLLLYLATTAIAISIALFIATLIAPGNSDIPKQALILEIKEKPNFTSVLTHLIPANPIQAMADGHMLQVIVFAVFIGLGLLKAGSKGKPIKKLFTSANEVILEVVMIVMHLAPIGIFCLLSKTFAEEGFAIISSLGAYFVTVLIALLLHLSITYAALLTLFAKLNPIRFLHNMIPAISFAFSTASSGATIPITLRTVEKKLGVHPRIASFTVPLGATINMDGTAIMQGVATVFIAGVYGIDLSITEYLTVILTATLASIGTAGVPGVGLIMLSMVLNQVSLPIEGIALILGVDRLLDMARTAVNISGDAMVSCIIARSEQAFDINVFNDKDNRLSEEN